MKYFKLGKIKLLLNTFRIDDEYNNVVSMNVVIEMKLYIIFFFSDHS